MTVPVRSANGFVLLDAMIAMAIIAVVGAMFVAVVQGWSTARRHVAQVREATLVATSQLAIAREGLPGPAAGRQGDLAWRTDLAPYPGSANGPGLVLITVIVRDARGGQVLALLHSLRLAR